MCRIGHWSPVEYLLAYKVLRRKTLVTAHLEVCAASFQRLIALYAIALDVGGLGKIPCEALAARIPSPPT